MSDSADDTVLLTIMLKHQKDKNLEEINAKLEADRFREAFPPQGVVVGGWYEMMGIGQVGTLRVPASRLRDGNLAIEKTAWGAFDTEFYATYDFRPVWESMRNNT